MNRNLAILMVIVGAVGFFLSSSLRAQDEGPMSSVKFVVLRDTDGKPLRNAAVVLHPLKRKGKQGSGEIELKTDPDGKAAVDGIPYGLLRVQVLAPHFQTFGEDYEINQPELEITVKMKHPGGQYSVYENHDEKKADDKKPQ